MSRTGSKSSTGRPGSAARLGFSRPGTRGGRTRLDTPNSERGSQPLLPSTPLKTPKPCRLGPGSPHRWSAWNISGSGVLSDCLERTNHDKRLNIAPDDPIFQVTLDLVRSEELQSILNEEVTSFWYLQGRRRLSMFNPRAATEAPQTQSSGSLFRDKVDAIVAAVREANALSKEVSIWNDRSESVRSEPRGLSKENAEDERFYRLQDFCTMYHASTAHCDISPSRQVASKKFVFSKTSLAGQASSTISPASTRSARVDEEMLTENPPSRRTELEWMWSTQGFYPDIDKESGPTTWKWPPKALKASMDAGQAGVEGAWKYRGALSHCRMGRWDWRRDSLPMPFFNEDVPRTDTQRLGRLAPGPEIWRDKAMSQTGPTKIDPKELCTIKDGHREGTAKQVLVVQAGVSNFLMPEHLSSSIKETADALSKATFSADSLNKRRGRLPPPPPLSNAASFAGHADALDRTNLPLQLSRSSFDLRGSTPLSTGRSSPSRSTPLLPSVQPKPSRYRRKSIVTLPTEAEIHLRMAKVGALEMGDPKFRSSHTWPWRGAAAAPSKSFQTPSAQYLEACSESGTVPILVPFVTGHSTRLTPFSKDIDDADLMAVTAMMKGVRVEEVDLGGCTLITEHALLPFIQSLRGAPASDFLQRLSFRRCPAMTPDAVSAVARLIGDQKQGVLKLRHLDLGGVPLGVRFRLPLCQAIREHTMLLSVNLSETGLGSGTDARQCVGELASSYSIQTLELGWNCFTPEVFCTLGESIVEVGRLRSLGLANCSAISAEVEGTKRVKKRTLERTPIVFFAETLARSTSLTTLDLALNRVDHRAALVIEDALETNRSLRELDISNNPLGALGMRSMIRLLSRSSSGLQCMLCRGCGDARDDLGENCIVFDPAAPTGRYRLDLAKPEDRAMLRMLYKIADRWGLPADSIFSSMACVPAFQHPTKDKIGLFILPDKGSFQALFSMERLSEGKMKNVADYDLEDVLCKISDLTRQKVHETKVVQFYALWQRSAKSPKDQAAMLDALATDFDLPYAQVRQLCLTKGATSQVLKTILPSVAGGTTDCGLSLLLAPNPAELVGVLLLNQSFFRWNAANPNGHYRLDLERTLDRAIAQRLHVLDFWEAGIALRRQYVDTSQRGNKSRLRNEKYRGYPLKVQSVAEWHLPHVDVLEFDYTSLRIPPPEATPLSDDTFTNILLALVRSECPYLERVVAVRSISHRIYVTSLQVRDLLGLFRDQEARMEMLVTIFSRIVDVQNEKVFRVRFEDQNDIFKLQHRLGYLVFHPFIQPENFLFDFDMSVQEERMALNILCVLASREGAANIKGWEIGDGPLYILEDGKRDPLTMGVPRSWEDLNKVPKGGTFKCRYICAPEDRKLELRKKYLELYTHIERDLDDKSVMWWSGINRVPEDLITLLFYVVQMFGNTLDAYKRMEGANGMTNTNEFRDFIKKINFTRLEGPNEDDRVKTVFRYLDPENTRSISRREWEVTEQLWQEIRLSIKNFVTFLVRMSMDISSAWSYFTEVGDARHHVDFMSLERWEKVCAKTGYFGPIRCIFTYLDKDGNGIIRREDFDVLKKFLDK